MRNIDDLVKNEVNLSQATVTGYCISCAIVTGKDFYLGHNHEYENPFYFEHAEKAALSNALQREVAPLIKKVVMFGQGKAKKFKHYTPCPSCLGMLSQYTTRETKIRLLGNDSSPKGLEFGIDELAQCYEGFSYSEIASSQLKNKTLLKPKDRRFIIDLIACGQRNKMKFYLTGSASGRGGASNLLMAKMNCSYEDLDLVCVLKNASQLAQAEIDIESALHEHYGSVTKVVRKVGRHINPKNVILSRTYYYLVDGKEPFIDLTYSLHLSGSFVRQDYEINNWFHALLP